MGAGKSSAARTVAAELGVPALDSDRELERELGEPLEAFFDREGESAFRSREQELVLRLLERPQSPVVALGGGAVGSEPVREALRNHTVVHLDVAPEDAWRRASGKGRPLARERERFDQLHRDRRTIYEAVADAILPPSERDAPRRALPALLALRDAPDGTRLLWASAASGDYPVFLGRGLIASGFFHPPDGRRFVVTDERVDRNHRMGCESRIVLLPGEEHKTIHGAELVLRQLAQAGAERGDLILAVGGGVVGDLAGFCAAIYQRGMRHVQVPTTVVAQVDSAYGGKTGVDLPEGKNYAGAYHQPAAVLADTATLASLPREELAAGFAEVIKTGLIAGGDLWRRVRGREAGGAGSPDRDLVLACARVKLRIVARDERDAGERQTLNLGHTVGHAIETVTRYERYRHGEAVGLGLLAALTLSDQAALRDEVAALLGAHGLPTRLDPAIDLAAVAAAVQRDKKRRGGRVGFVLLDAPGEPRIGCPVSDGALARALQELAR